MTTMNSARHTLLTLCMGMATLTMNAQADHLNLIPRPLQVQTADGSFPFTSSTTLAYKGKEAKDVVRFLASKLKASTGVDFKVTQKTGHAGTISFIIDPKVKGAEAYEL